MRGQEKVWSEDPEQIIEMQRRWGIVRTQLRELVDNVESMDNLNKRLRKSGPLISEGIMRAYRKFQYLFRNWGYGQALIKKFLENFKNDKFALLRHALTVHTSAERPKNSVVVTGLKDLTQELIDVVCRDEYWEE